MYDSDVGEWNLTNVTAGTILEVGAYLPIYTGLDMVHIARAVVGVVGVVVVTVAVGPCTSPGHWNSLGLSVLTEESCIPDDVCMNPYTPVDHMVYCLEVGSHIGTGEQIQVLCRKPEEDHTGPPMEVARIAMHR